MFKNKDFENAKIRLVGSLILLGVEDENMVMIRKTNISRLV